MKESYYTQDPLLSSGPDEYICVHVRYVESSKESGYLFTAVDPFSRKTKAYHIGLSPSVAEYMWFLDQLEYDGKLVPGTIVVCDLPSRDRDQILEVFPALGGVRMEPEIVEAVTNQAFIYFLAKMGERPGN
jgi:hypothetical protein